MYPQGNCERECHHLLVLHTGKKLVPRVIKKKDFERRLFVAEELLSEAFEEYYLYYINEEHDLFYSICAESHIFVTLGVNIRLTSRD